MLTRTRLRLIVLSTLVLGLAYAYWPRTPYMVRQLPQSAHDVHVLELDMFPDFSFSVSAALSDADCREYVSRVAPELELLEPEALREKLGEEAEWGLWWGGREPEGPRSPWWRPLDVGEYPTWYANNGGAWELIQCTGEHMFYESWSH